MATRHSEYEAQPDQCYVTPGWVWDLLYSVEPWARDAFDCAPIVRNGYDFLTDWDAGFGDIATNPPYGKLAERFVRHALDIRPARNIAMLLPHAWDGATNETEMKRLDLFENQRFKGKYSLTRRIRWANIEQKKSGPSGSHAWFVWQSEPRGFIWPRPRWLQ